jgi:hypothetical protein
VEFPRFCDANAAKAEEYIYMHEDFLGWEGLRISPENKRQTVVNLRAKDRSF